MDARGVRLLLVLLMLVGVTAGVLFFEARQESVRQTQAEEFQRLVGGMGFGPASDWEDCPFSFDPRLGGSCGLNSGPLPGGSCFCPRHAESIFSYPALQPQHYPAQEGSSQ